MVEEHGTIIESSDSHDGLVLIETVLQDGCESCTSKPLCHGEDGSDIKTVEAYNPLGAVVGDRVLFQVPTAIILQAGASAYLYPLISLVVGIFFGQAIGDKFFPSMDKELIGFAVGVFFVVSTYGLINIYSSKQGYGKQYRPVVVKILA